MSIFLTNLVVTKIDIGAVVDPIETMVLREPWEVQPRLAELGLRLHGLLRAVTVALNERANVTPFHCANASGTLAYQQGTWALRDEFVGNDWRVDRTEGVEGIWNDTLRVRVVFSNVDVSCNYDHPPKPCSKKGAGAERVCQPNLFGLLPHYAPRASDADATYYLMTDENGAAELTRPVISDDTFSAYVERIFLSTGRDDDFGDKLSLDDDDAVVDFDPQIARK